MFLSNQQYYGHLINADNYDISITRPEFYQLVNNKLVRNLLISGTNVTLFLSFSRLSQHTLYRARIDADMLHLLRPCRIGNTVTSTKTTTLWNNRIRLLNNHVQVIYTIDSWCLKKTSDRPSRWILVCITSLEFNENVFLKIDVYWFPLVTPAYADDLITIMESYGKWSNGKNDVSTHWLFGQLFAGAGSSRFSVAKGNSDSI